MSAEQLIEHYGYLAVLIGTFLEGETILVLAGLLAKLGHLSFSGVVLAAFAGSLLGDQLYFHLGRRYGRALLARRPQWQAKAERLDGLLVRWGALLVLGFRFLYGLRTVSPFAIGMSGFPALKFVMLNAGGAALWSLVIAGLGYLFGHGLELILGNLHQYRWLLIALVALAGAGIWLAHGWYSRRRPEQGTGGESRAR